MKERILKMLRAYLETNREVLDSEEIRDIEEQIAAVDKYKTKFTTMFGKRK